MDNLSARVAAMTTISSEQKVSAELETLRIEITAQREKLAAIDGAIRGDPELLLSLPMLRRDVAALTDAYKQDVTLLRAEVDRIYTMGQWMIGLFVLVGISLGGFAVRSFSKRGTDS